MWKAGYYHVKLPRVALVLASVFLLFASCGDVERHKVMTFFFDGVPPLPEETVDADVADASLGETTRASRTGGWYVHEPLSDCTQCHASGRQRTFSRKAQLVADVPQLCHKCHQEYTSLEGWVHGPVATGQCLLCHEPHKARNEFLLTKPVPDLCYQCHEPEAVRLVENHAEASYAHCIDCHEGHAGATKSLLRPTFLRKPAGLTYLSEVYQRQYEESIKKARNDLAQGPDFSSMLRATVDHIEAGRLWSARAYLEVAGGGSLFTDEEKLKLSDVLRQLTSLAEAERARQLDGSEAEASLSADQEALAATLRALQDQRGQRDRAIAERYYRSIKLYHAGEFVEARAGFLDVLEDASVPAPIKETAKVYLERIEAGLKEVEKPGWQVLR